MRADPSFSKAEIVPFSTFLRMADIKPSSGTSMLAAEDAVFNRILSAVEEQGQVTAQKLMIDDLTKIITVDKGHPDLGDLLYEVAKSEAWMDQLKTIEEICENSPTAVPPSTAALNEHSTKILEKLQKSAASDGPQLIRLFLSTPRFSSILEQEVLAYYEVRDKLQNAKSLLNKNFESISGPDRYSRIAVTAVSEFPPAKREKIETTLSLQARAAQYFLERCKFAKLDALAFKWPDLAEALRADVNDFIRTWETPANGANVQVRKDSPEERLARDRNLLDFLRLRPLFSGILDRELTQYFAVSQVVVKTSDIQKASSAAPTFAPAPPKTEPEVVIYNDVILHMHQLDDHETYSFSVQSKARQSQATNIKLPLAEIQRLNSQVQDIFLYRSVTREPFAQEVDPMLKLKEIGTSLYNLVFKTEGPSGNSVAIDQSPETLFREAVDEALKLNQRVRIILEFKEGLPMLLPWEAMFIPTWGLFPALTANIFSIVRRQADVRKLSQRILVSPLRILVALASPVDAPYLEIDREKSMLDESLAAAVNK